MIAFGIPYGGVAPGQHSKAKSSNVHRNCVTERYSRASPLAVPGRARYAAGGGGGGFSDLGGGGRTFLYLRDLADRLDGRPAQILEHSGPDSDPITKIVREFVHVTETPEQIAAEGEEPLLIEWRAVRDANGTGNEDTARTKR